MRYTFPVAVIVLLLLMMFMNAHFIRRIESFEANAGYYLSGDGSWAGQMRPAAASADGSTGLVPSPLAGQHNSYLRGDGKWIQAGNAPTAAQYLFAKNTDKQGPLGNDPTPVYLSFPIENTLTVGIAATHTDPKTFTILPGYSYKITAAIPLTTTPNSDFDWVGIYVNGVSQGIRGTGVPASNGNAIGDFFTVCYVTPTAPSRVQVGYIGTYGATIYYVWCSIEIISNNNTILPFKGASVSADGAIGYIPTPKAGQQNYLLEGSGNWTGPQYWFGTAIGTSPTFTTNDNNTVLFTVSSSAGATIKQLTPGTFRLAAGNTYKCCCVISANPNVATNIIYGWMANNGDIGVQSRVNSRSTAQANNTQATAYVVATADTTVYVRAVYFAGESDLSTTWCSIELLR